VIGGVEIGWVFWNGWVRSMSPPIGAFLAAEIAFAVLPAFRVRLAPVLHGMPYAARGRSVSPYWTGAPNSRARSSDAHGGASTARETAPRSIDGR